MTTRTTTSCGAPAQSFLTLLGTPGLRLGIAPETAPYELFFDQLQQRLDSSVRRAGAGLSRINDHDFLYSRGHETAPTFGGGLGVRHRLHHGYGTLRAEVRYDRLVASQAENYFLDGNSVALKLGFDVWGN